jgi:hypothetical protein
MRTAWRADDANGFGYDANWLGYDANQFARALSPLGFLRTMTQMTLMTELPDNAPRRESTFTSAGAEETNVGIEYCEASLPI